MSEAKATKKPARPIENKEVEATEDHIRVDANFEVKESIYPTLRIVRNAK